MSAAPWSDAPHPADPAPAHGPPPMDPPTPEQEAERAAERAICGAVLADPQGLHFQAAQGAGLTAAALQHPAHAAVWYAVAELREQGRPVDLITASAALAPVFSRPAYKGHDAAWLAGLLLEAPALPESTAEHARVVLQGAHRRRLGQVLEELGERHRGGRDLGDLPAQLAEMDRIRREGPAPRRRVACLSESILQDYASPIPPPVPTGFAPLDDRIRGLRYGLYVLNGPTGQGKTGFCLQVARSLADSRQRQDWRPVLYLSTEIDRRQLNARLIAQTMATQARPRGAPSWSAVYDELANHAEWAEHLRPLRLYPVRLARCARPGEEIRRLCDEVTQAEGRPPVVILDYLQQLTDGLPELEARRATIGVNEALRAFTEETRTAALTVCRVSRNFYANKARDMSDEDLLGAAKEAGEIETGAVLVMFLYATLLPDAPPPYPAELVFSKHRYGPPLPRLDLSFHGASGLFSQGEGALDDLEWAILEALRDGPLPIVGEGGISRQVRARNEDVCAAIRRLVNKSLVSGRPSRLTPTGRLRLEQRGGRSEA